MLLKDAIGRINAGPFLDPAQVTKDDIPAVRGVYVWVEAQSKQPNYIGVAAGRLGLRQRILRQHLNPNYLESRRELWTHEDESQATHGVTLRGNLAIEKSAFRKNLARALHLKPGEDTIRFILENFRLFILPLPNLEPQQIKQLESRLISKFRPKLNRAGMKRKNISDDNESV